MASHIITFFSLYQVNNIDGQYSFKVRLSFYIYGHSPIFELLSIFSFFSDFISLTLIITKSGFLEDDNNVIKHHFLLLSVHNF